MNRAQDRTPPAELLEACALPQAWRGHTQWRVLDTCFGEGETFLALWAAWRADPLRAQRLHVLALDEHPTTPAAIRGAAPPALGAEADALAQQCQGLLPGVHRLVFEAGAVQLTLHLGRPSALWRELRIEADSIFLKPRPAPADSELAWLKSVARCCRRGTRLAGCLPASDPALRECGFQPEPSPAGVAFRSAAFEPSWPVRTRRDADLGLPEQALAAGRCLVIGAGLAGSACASSLARRGWQVTVLERAAPASGASGLPAGLMAPHVSPDDSPLSRLSRAGLRATWLEAQRLLEEGEDWAAVGVLQRGLADAPSSLPAEWPAEGHFWSQDASAHGALPPPWQAQALWHARGGWIKPGALVRAWLAEPGIKVQAGAAVHSLQRTPSGAWQALDSAGHCLGEAELLVLAAAHHSQALLEPLLDGHGLGLQAVRGQVSGGLLQPDDRLPPFPLNGHGSLLSYPGPEGPTWLMGATFERDDTGTDLRPSGHAANLARLAQLEPQTFEQLERRFQDGLVNGWAGVRCTSRDHLPAVGPVSPQWPGLWLCTAFGSRGLSYSALCAELLAAWLHAEPWPLERRLALALRAGRLSQER